LAIVTGRPRADALRFLEQFDLLDVFGALVCREDAPLKPDPAPVRAALERLGVRRAWMLGDTRDDLEAARGAGVLPIGVVAAGMDPTHTRLDLERAGAACVLERVNDLEELLP
jgi:phosphoglycolate phosphatase